MHSTASCDAQGVAAVEICGQWPFLVGAFAAALDDAHLPSRMTLRLCRGAACCARQRCLAISSHYSLPDRRYNRAILMRKVPFLPSRHSVRLKGFDYAQPSAYFLRICAHKNKCLFGEVIFGEMKLNALGKIVNECWLGIPNHFPNVEIVTHVVMPNHFHGIVGIQDRVRSAETDAHGDNVAKHLRRAQHAAPLRKPFAEVGPRSISALVRSFKAATTKRIREILRKPLLSVWQRGYYEHIIRGKDDFDNAYEYVRPNPARWDPDEEKF